MLFLLRNKHPVLLLRNNRPLSTCYSALRFAFSLRFCTRIRFWSKVAERINEFFSKEGFVLNESVLLRSKSSALNVLNLKLYGLRRNSRNVYVEIVFHKIIIITDSTLTLFTTKKKKKPYPQQNILRIKIE